FANVIVPVRKGPGQRVYRPPIAKLAQGLGGSVANVVVPVPKGPDQRLDRPRTAQLDQGVGGGRPRPTIP
ncbi:MAG TPA: hypothetical protein VMY37_10385, partial [Thermoguttaceae bacterium]|nr:hypothetical protein [Thermoguttaceae bacterium]